MGIIRPGQGKKDASAPRLLMVVSRQGKAQLSEDVSNLVPGQCPISSYRVLVEENQEKAVEIIGENRNKYRDLLGQKNGK